MTRNKAIDIVQTNIDRLRISSRGCAWRAINEGDKDERIKLETMAHVDEGIAKGLEMALGTLKSINSLKEEERE